tara:strand:+ start:1117 stop:1425 length:309 start_codon:yes stop_codon:yes gene_type:complete
MSNYIHNGHVDHPEAATLRMDLNNPVFHPTFINQTQYFVVAIFESNEGRAWDEEWVDTRAYCGIISDIHDKVILHEGLYLIMKKGAKPYSLAKWLVGNNITG